MNKRIFTAIFVGLVFGNTFAQKIDFNLSGRESTSTEDGYTSWVVNRATGSQSKTFDKVTITVEAVTGDQYDGNGCNNNWWKNGVNSYSKLISDAVYPVILDAKNDYTPSKTKAMGLRFTISGLTAGEHSLCAYHNNTDGIMSPGYPTVSVMVNGDVKQSGVTQTIQATKLENSGMSYVRFTAEDGKDVVVEYVTTPSPNDTYINNYVAVNALIFDQPNPQLQATCVSPENHDYHADCDLGTATLKWSGATGALKHRVMFGTGPDNLQQVQESDLQTYTTGNLTALNKYYWRIDEIDSNGRVFEGDVWSFRPRHLAFPGAEGYGKYAIGGRGGTVYHVTSLEDDVDNPQPGTFRYGITKVNGARTIVFDVCGYITLKGRLSCSDPYVTIAGQTAPGQGITFRGAPLGVASDGITRFIRSYRGYAGTKNGPDEADQNKGLDGLGMAGCDNAIVDHCSVSWTTDEAFSSRNAHSITLQHTMLSEALNCADHPNYGAGTEHGYAATIGGGCYYGHGSFHHNLLAHCEGRNWSLSGGLDGSGYYSGAHDVFNNVCYNWGGRATDGGTHELNFVNNYYKMGPATTQKYLLRHQFEGTGKGSQEAYVSGNIRENLDGTKTQDKEGVTYRYELSGGQKLDWQPWAIEPFFESLAAIESAEAAYVNVLSDVGCNQPFFNAHDKRMVRETYNGTTSTVGSKTGKKGLIDREWDEGCEGYTAIEEIQRPADFDTDQDGMPDWWENVNANLNPNVADNNSDADGDGYTAIEEYLNYMACPHFEVNVGDTLSIKLHDYFTGYPVDATYSLIQNEYVSCKDGVLKVIAGSQPSITAISVTANTGTDISLTRQFNIYSTGVASGIESVHGSWFTVHDSASYNIAGQKVSSNYRGIVIKNGRVTVKKQ